MLTPAQRRLRARGAAHAMHARHPAAETTRAGTAAFMAKFERQVDPDGVLDPAERTRRADHARRSYMAMLALKSAKVRRARAEP